MKLKQITISRGEIIAKDRELLAAPGRGELVKRKTFSAIGPAYGGRK